MRRLIPLIAIIFVYAPTLTAATRPEASPLVPGTYTNFHNDDESGDLLGVEIKIVPVAGERFQAAVQVSEGEPGPLAITEVTVRGNKVSFAVGSGDDGWTFSGVVAAKELRGLLTYSSGRRGEIRLTRKCGYWDK